jgi:hypothetical protein
MTEGLKGFIEGRIFLLSFGTERAGWMGVFRMQFISPRCAVTQGRLIF